MSLPEIILSDNRQKVAVIAQSMLDGRIGIIEGSRQLAALLHSIDVGGLDDDFLPFIAVDSETDHLPLGDVRNHWAADALPAKTAEITAAEAFHRDDVLAACSRVLLRFPLQTHSEGDFDPSISRT